MGYFKSESGLAGARGRWGRGALKKRAPGGGAGRSQNVEGRIFDRSQNKTAPCQVRHSIIVHDLNHLATASFPMSALNMYIETLEFKFGTISTRKQSYYLYIISKLSPAKWRRVEEASDVAALRTEQLATRLSIAGSRRTAPVCSTVHVLY